MSPSSAEAFSGAPSLPAIFCTLKVYVVLSFFNPVLQLLVDEELR